MKNLILTALLLFSVQSQAAPVEKSTTTPTPEELMLASNIHGSLKQNPQLAKLIELVWKNVVADIELEASLQNPKQTRDDYADSDTSFSKFVTDLEQTNFDPANKADFLVKFFRASHRVKIQTSYVNKPANFDQNRQRALTIMTSVAAKAATIEF